MRYILTMVMMVLVLSYTICQKNQSIDIIGGVEYGYRNVVVSPPNRISSFSIQIRNESEKGLIHFRYGINYNKQITPQFYLKSGLRIGSAGYKDENNDLIWPSNLSNPGASNPINIESLEIYYKFRFIELPMMARYEWNQKKWIPFIEFGIAPTIFLSNISVKNHEPSPLERRYTGVLPDIYTIHFAGIVSAGIQYNLSESYQIFTQPTYRYHFTKLTENSSSDFLYNIGLEFGIRKKW